MAKDQVTFSAIKLSQVQVYFEGGHIGRLERAVGYEHRDCWGLSDRLVDRYGRGHDLQIKGLDDVKRWVWALEMDYQRQMEKEKHTQKPRPKRAWAFLWDSPPEAQTRPMKRSRVAELLHDARDRGEKIERTPKGYAIGYALRLIRLPGEAEESDPEPQGGCPREAGAGAVR